MNAKPEHNWLPPPPPIPPPFQTEVFALASTSFNQAVFKRLVFLFVEKGPYLLLLFTFRGGGGDNTVLNFCQWRTLGPEPWMVEFYAPWSRSFSLSLSLPLPPFLPPSKLGGCSAPHCFLVYTTQTNHNSSTSPSGPIHGKVRALSKTTAGLDSSIPSPEWKSTSFFPSIQSSLPSLHLRRHDTNNITQPPPPPPTVDRSASGRWMRPKKNHWLAPVAHDYYDFIYFYFSCWHFTYSSPSLLQLFFIPTAMLCITSLSPLAVRAVQHQRPAYYTLFRECRSRCSSPSIRRPRSFFSCTCWLRQSTVPRYQRGRFRRVCGATVEQAARYYHQLTGGGGVKIVEAIESS